MNWINIESFEDLKSLIEQSFNKPQLIYKHSTRCGRCTRVKEKLDEYDTPQNIDFHYLDLWKHRDISNKIADDFNITHESPQVILLQKGVPIYFANHWKIDMEDIMAVAKRGTATDKL